MRSHRLKMGLGVLCLPLLCPGVWAAGPPANRPVEDVLTLAKRIDRHLAAGFVKHKVTPAPLAGDAEFVRRVYLDLAGRIPRVSEARLFLESKKPDKRRRLVEQLLSSSLYVNHFTNVWRALLLPQNNNQQVQFYANQIQNWVRIRLRDNAPYDKMVRDLLTTRVVFNPGRRGFVQPADYDANAVAFYLANEMKSDNLAAATSRLFLGVKLECAQCHDHPFADWTRKQFWEYTAFFAGIKPQSFNGRVFTPASDDPKVREITIPSTGKKVSARFLDGKIPDWKEETSSRAALAEWMTARNNPFFARAAANRLWEHFFGIGLVDPVDDARDDNPPSHPDLLDDLARQFVAHKFDIKYLVRVITATQAYQRTSSVTHKSQTNTRAFGRMYLKGLTGEQLFDSLVIATGYRANQPAPGGFFAFNNPRQDFLNRFANPVDRRTEPQTSILQALTLMNGQFIADATSLTRSETLAAVLDSPFMDTRQRLDTLYLAALSRPMRSYESSRLVPYVNSGGPSRNSNKALADVFWVLLNSSEFILNH
jgi:hypothetical protein